MILKLLDYKGRETLEDIGELDEIAAVVIRVITGDEIATIIYKDGLISRIDSSRDRMADYFDDEYVVYVNGVSKEENLLFNEEFIKRTDSYWQWNRESS